MDDLLHFLKSLALGTALSWSVILLLAGISYPFHSPYAFLISLWLAAVVLIWGLIQGWLFDFVDWVVDRLEDHQHARRSRA